MAEFVTGVGILSNLLNLIVISVGGYFTYKNIINFADLFAYTLYVNFFMQPIRRLTEFAQQYQDGMTGFERFIDIMDIEAEIVDKEDAIEIENLKGEINFENVSFSYGKGEASVLKNINLNIPSGKTVALVGPSGAGKTTLCHFYGNPDASEDDIVIAAKNANIHDFIKSLPDAYDTYIGDKGVMLSGGQKQRISIARLFLKNPTILILDEATSALDNETEIVIQKSLEKLSRGRTSLVIAHRLSTIKNADIILVLTEEGIVEKGSHERLLEKDGLYSKLYNSQFSES